MDKNFAFPFPKLLIINVDVHKHMSDTTWKLKYILLSLNFLHVRTGHLYILLKMKELTIWQVSGTQVSVELSEERLSI